MTDFDLSNYATTTKSYNRAFVARGYTIYNSSLTFEPQGGKYSITAYGRNLGDVIYKSAAANGNPAGSPPSYAFFVNEPRTFGLLLSARL